MKKQLIVISGVSGAGKTTASIILEDYGYRCIDDYPVELLEDLVNLLENDSTGKYSKVALTIRITDLDRFYKLIENVSLNPEIILIDCDKDEAINRYKFTRRVHPLMQNNVADTLVEAIEIEKKVIEKYRSLNCHIIDTTNLTKKQHAQKLDVIIKHKDVQNLSVTFESFGFKNGVPDDADIVIDTRILENPFYVDNLKNKTGLDKRVRDYVLNNDKAQNFLPKLIDYLDYTLKSYGTEERRHITVCIGCTGGQHRSVTVAKYLFDHYKNEYMCYIHHREIGD